MPNQLQDLFTQAIQDKKIVKITFDNKERGGILTRTAIPFDFGVSERYKDGKHRFYFYALDSENEKPNYAILTELISEVEVLNDTFDPATYVTWEKINWIMKRDWGKYS